MKKLIILFLVLLISTQFAQEVTRQEIEDINAAIVSSLGEDYSASDIINVDKINNTMWQYGFEISDTYSTLTGCYVFLADAQVSNNFLESTGVVGIYKDGTILWASEPTIKIIDLRHADIMGIMDLNKDGYIDIVTSWYSGIKGQLADIWILSWNGNTGWFINGINENGYSEISNVDAYDIGILDTNGDNILEICVADECFFWNGDSYSSFEPFPEVVPKDKLFARVKCKVNEAGNYYKYGYSIKNEPNSLQKIVQFGIDNKSENVNNFTAPENWNFSLGGGFDFLVSDIKIPVWDHPVAFIKQGYELGGYSFESAGLPSITNIYIQGYNTEPDFDKEKIKSNSFITVTLSASNPPSPFEPIAFIDTLINYTDSSYSLSWIANQTTKDKYDSLFNTAKTQLQQNNNNAAKTTLQTVLQEVDIDSTNNLTSEAYALLRYNTEYLINQIPVGSPGLPVKLINSQGSLLPGGSLKYYDAGWKDAIDNGDGTFTVNTERTTVSLKMTYEYGTQQIDNIPVGSDTAVFQTVNAAVQLKDSQGNLMPAPLGDEGTVKYYAGGWRDFGTTVNGTATKELLPKNYSFRMSYEFVSNDKQQDLSANSTVTFSTVLCTVKVSDTNNQLLENAEVKYYSGGWREIGLTNAEGIITKELLPKTLNFRAIYGNVSEDKQQDIGLNGFVEIILNIQ